MTDPGFAAGVESQKNHVHGVLKGLGNGSARVDFVPTGQKVEVGEMFFTSGEDRVFPKGLPVGKVTGVREGANFQDITVQPTGTETAPEEVLVILDPVHQAIPEEASARHARFPRAGCETGCERRRRRNRRGAAPTADKLGPVQEDRRRPEARVRRGRAGHAAAEFQSEGAGRERSRRLRVRRHRRLRGGPGPTPKPPVKSSARKAAALMEYPASSRIMVDSARQVRSATYPVWVYFAIPLLALLIQVYLPLFQTLRFHLADRIAAAGHHLFRADAAVAAAGSRHRHARSAWRRIRSSSSTLGMYGICKTLVGYFSASIGMQFDVEHAFVRLVLCFIFYLFHQFFYWLLQRSLLDQPAVFQIQTELILALINAVIGVVLFHFLDKLRKRE